MLCRNEFTPPFTEIQAERRKAKRKKHEQWLRRGLSALWRARHGGSNFITDDDEGRVMIKAQLRVKTTPESVIECAPWAEPEIDALRKDARKMPWPDIGKMLKLTNKERLRHRLCCWRPIEPWEDVQKEQRERNKVKAKERQRKQRAKRKADREAVDNSDTREDAIVMMLAAEMAGAYASRGITPPEFLVLDGWMRAPIAIKRAQTMRAFWRPDGRPPNPASLGKMFHRALDRLEADGEMETKMVPGRRGPVRLFRFTEGVMMADRGGRRDAFCHGDSMTSVSQAETAEMPMACAEKPASDTLSRSPKRENVTAASCQHTTPANTASPVEPTNERLDAAPAGLVPASGLAAIEERRTDRKEIAQEGRARPSANGVAAAPGTNGHVVVPQQAADGAVHCRLRGRKRQGNGLAKDSNGRLRLVFDADAVVFEAHMWDTSTERRIATMTEKPEATPYRTESFVRDGVRMVRRWLPDAEPDYESYTGSPEDVACDRLIADAQRWLSRQGEPCPVADQYLDSLAE
jgi:hypothetical protein